jgi:hypothetical protein
MRRMFAAMLLLACGLMISAPAAAQTCSPAASQGTAPASWQTYCWINFGSYSDTAARSVGGQNFSITLSDGAVLSFNVRVSGSAIIAAAAPSWTGSAVGNSAFLGIPGNPILYQQAAGATTITISAIAITPPPGVSAVTAYMFVAADAESTDNSESIVFTTNGAAWQLLDAVPPITGSQMPSQSGIGSSIFTTGGAGLTGNVGGYIIGSTSPTSITTTLNGGGLQGAMFAVRFASIRLNKQIVGARINAADQFTFEIRGAGPGGILMATGTSTGTSLGPFTAATLSLASGIPLRLVETMAPGSVTPLGEYESRLTCTNSNSSSSTVLPTNVLTTDYTMGALQFGDAIQCTFNNRPYPHIQLTKLLGAGGRRFNTDQFTVRVRNGATVVTSATTTGTGSTVTSGSTAMAQVAAGTAYSLDEIPAGSMADLSQYTQAMTCTNANVSSTTVLGTGYPRTITPQLGDVISCSITNTRLAANANLVLDKASSLLSDPVTGSVSPFHIPGASVRYALRVYNTGSLAVDAGTVFVYDTLPAGVAYDTSGAVTFTNGAVASGLSFNPATDVAYSSSAGPPANFAACNYTPITTVDPAIRHVCFRPTGTMAAASAAGQPSFTIAFTARVQ